VLVITEVEKGAESNFNSSGDPFSPDRFFSPTGKTKN